VIAVEVRSTAGAAWAAAPTTGAAAGGWARAGTNASCLPPAFPDAGPENRCSIISIESKHENKWALSKIVPTETSKTRFSLHSLHLFCVKIWELKNSSNSDH